MTTQQSATSTGFLTRLNERNGLIRRFCARVAGSKAHELERLIKFLIIGGLGAIIDLGLTNLFLQIFQVQDGDVPMTVLAAAIGFSTAVSSNFFWNRYWTYPDSRSRSVRTQLIQFVMVSLVGLGIRAFIVSTLSTPLSDVVYQVAKPTGLNWDNHDAFVVAANMTVMLCQGIVAFWNFFANRFWTYADVDKKPL
jgi:putative flippase GtrA